MEKKYEVLNLKIDKNADLILNNLTEKENKVIDKRNVVYIYYGKKKSLHR